MTPYADLEQRRVYHQQYYRNHLERWHASQARKLAEYPAQRESWGALMSQLVCEDCGSPARLRSSGYWSLDFHHRDPATKSFAVGMSHHRAAWATLLAEIAKCDVLCRRCHAARHRRRT